MVQLTLEVSFVDLMCGM